MIYNCKRKDVLKNLYKTKVTKKKLTKIKKRTQRKQEGDKKHTKAR